VSDSQDNQVQAVIYSITSGKKLEPKKVEELTAKVGKPKIVVEEKKLEPDKDTQFIADYFKQNADNGQIRGCIVIGWDAVHDELCTQFVLPDDMDLNTAAAIFAGACAMVQKQLLDVVEEVFEEEFDDDDMDD
jgi:hypothetical protein